MTLLRRDCAKLIQALEAEEGAPGAAVALRDRYAAVVGVLPRMPSTAALDGVGAALAALASDVGKLLIAITMRWNRAALRSIRAAHSEFKS